MKTFFKGFCIGLLSLSLLGLLWFLVLQPGLTNKEAQDLKEEYAQPLPGESSGELPAGKEQAASLVNLSALQAEYPDIQGWISIPGTCVDYPVLQSSADEPEYYLRRTYKGEHRTAGSIFFQWDCSPESRNLVVYGHNMSDGTMFAVLQKMADEAFRTAQTGGQRLHRRSDGPDNLLHHGGSSHRHGRPQQKGKHHNTQRQQHLKDPAVKKLLHFRSALPSACTKPLHQPLHFSVQLRFYKREGHRPGRQPYLQNV